MQNDDDLPQCHNAKTAQRDPRLKFCPRLQNREPETLPIAISAFFP